jgi:glycosyltransferase involved in cell wall biosynthesis
VAPLVSILLPVRDAGPELEACLDSLAAQTLADHEVVAVDDGSADGSGERLLARAARDPRVRVLRTPPRGLVPALDLALAEARSPLVARMDADDVARPARLEAQVRRLREDTRVDVLGGRVAIAALPGRRVGEGMRAYVEWVNSLLDHEQLARDRFVESPIVHPTVAMRTDVLRALGGWRDGVFPEDYDLWLRAFDAGLRFAKLPQVVLDWRDSPGRLTRNDPRYAPAAFARLKAEALCRGPLAAGRPAVVWGAGPLGKAFARALRGAGCDVAAFVEVDPRKIGQRVQGAPVVGLDGALRLGALHLGAVGQKGARERLRDAARSLGLVDGQDFFAVA